MAVVITLLVLIYHHQMSVPLLFFEDPIVQAIAAFGNWTLALSSATGPLAKLSLLAENVVLGQANHYFRLLTMFWWTAGLIIWFIALKALYERPLAALILTAFITMHSLNVPMLSLIAGRGYALGMALIGVAWYLAKDRRDLSILRPEERQPRSFVAIGLLTAATPLVSPLWCMGPLFFLVIAHRELKRERTSRLPLMQWWIAAAALSVASMIGYGALTPADKFLSGLTPSFSQLLTAGLSSLWQDMQWLVYPRYITWQRYETSLGASTSQALMGAATLMATFAAVIFAARRKTAFSHRYIPWGLGLLFIGEITAIMQPIFHKGASSAADAVVLIPGAAMLAVGVLRVVWGWCATKAVLRMSLTVMVIAATALLMYRTMLLDARWASWPTLGSWNTNTASADPTWRQAWASYFLSKRSVEGSKKARTYLDDHHGESLPFMDVLRARAAVMEHRSEDAVALYKRYLDRPRSDYIAIIFEAATLLVQMDRFDEASVLMQRLPSNSVPALYLKALVHEQRGEYDEAETAIRSYLSRRPHDSEGLMVLCRILAARKDYQRAKACLELAVNSKSSVEEIRLLAEVYLGLDRCAEAQTLIVRSARNPDLDPEDRAMLDHVADVVQRACNGAGARRYDVGSLQPPRPKAALPEPAGSLPNAAPSPAADPHAPEVQDDASAP